MIALRPLQRFVAAPPSTTAPSESACELCGAPIGDPHRHVVDIEQRGLHCACHACSILFVRTSAQVTRFRTVPERIARVPAFALTAAAWSALGVPVGLAFVFRSSALDTPVLCYPGPAGVTEAEAPPGLWDAIVAAGPLATTLEPDVEAVLVHGERGATQLDAYVIPIDRAYALAGRLRRCWRGFSGGGEAERELAAFFAELAAAQKGPSR